MKLKYNLTSPLSIIFIYVINIIGLGFFSFLIYSIVMLNVVAIAVFTSFIIVLYISFFRKFIRFKNVTFDSKFIYVDNLIISLNEITEIKTGKITYIKNNVTKCIYYNYFYGINYKQLIDFYQKEKIKKSDGSDMSTQR